MKYVSTRGQAPVLDFADVLLAGLASDGGLYVPGSWPALPDRWDEPRPYAELAAEVLWPYVDGSPVARPDLDRMDTSWRPNTPATAASTPGRSATSRLR